MVINNLNKINQVLKKSSMIFGLSWFEMIGELWKLGKSISSGMANQVLYEVINYETTLTIQDRNGKKASVSKKQRVRFLQDNVIAYQDQAWGDGDVRVWGGWFCFLVCAGVWAVHV